MGVLGHFRDSVTLVNRTPRPLNVRYDGEDIVLLPGENPGFPAIAVPYAKRQNPLMGSKHPLNPNLFISMVAVKDTKDDCTPFSADVLEAADAKLEAIDRDGSYYGEPQGRVELLRKAKTYSAYEAQTAVGGLESFGVNRNID